MSVQDYELLLRVRTDLQQALKGLDNLRTTADADAAAVAGLNKQASAAAGSVDKLATASAQVSTRGAASVNTIKAMGVSAGQTANAMRQLPAQITDIVTGLASGQGVFTVAIQQGGQIRDSFGGISGAVKGLASVITPVRLVIGAGVAALGGLAYAAIQGAKETDALNAAIAKTGNYAGVTVGQVRDLAAELGSGSGKTSTYTDALTQLVATGKVAGSQLAVVATSVVNFSEVTGKSIEQAVAKFAALGDDPVKAIRALDAEYHILSLSEYEQIKTLQAQGDAEGALAIAQAAAAKEFAARAAEMRGQLSTLGQAWESVKDSASNAWEAMKGILQQKSISEDLSRITDQIARTKQELIEIGGLTDAQAEATAQVQGLRSQQQSLTPGANLEKWAAQTLAQGIADREAVKKGLDFLQDAVDQYDTRTEKYVKQINAINKAADAAITKAPNLAGQINAARDQAVQRAVDDFQSSQSKKTRKARDDNQKYVDAQQALIRSLEDLQGQLDPAAAVWNRYNQAVEKANDDAVKAKRARGANIEAIDAQRNAVVQLEASIRDAALDKLAAKDRQEFEKLRDSLRTPAEVKLDNAADQIKKLNQYLKDGVISSAEYKSALAAVSKTSITDLPKYQGLDASVGGVNSELSKNFEAEKALNDAYAQRLKENEDFRAQDAANEEVYQQRLAMLQEQYATQRNRIEASRQQLQLQASSDFFGQLAALSQSGNSKIAAIGKAAAISKTIIDTYSSATAAYKALADIPYVGPVLGAAAAAAAIAAGLANVARIRSQPTGFSDGGYTGPGGINQPAGIVHAGEVVWSQRDVARVGGVSVAEAIRLGKVPGYAGGGFVRAYTDTSGFAMARTPDALSSDLSSPAQPSSGAPSTQKHVHLWDKDQAAQEIASSPQFEKAVLHVVGNNPRHIQSKWSKG